MKRWIVTCALALGITHTVLAQAKPTSVSSPAGSPINSEQFAQHFRALLTTGGTQAVIQAVSEAVQQALKQGPMNANELAQVTAPSGVTLSAPVTPPPPVAPKTWVDAITLAGDIRYRFETIKDDSKTDKTKDNNEPYVRERDRIRARLGADVKVNDDVKAGIRLTTDEAATIGGGGDPISGNQTLTGGGSKKGVYLDLAYIDWNLFGEGNSELHTVVGKMNNPFITFNDDLVWDPDLTPEGLALKGSLDLFPVTLLGNFGYFWIAERDSNKPITMVGGQGAARVEFIPEITLTVGTSLYTFQNVRGSDVVDYKYDLGYERAVNLPSKINYPSGYGNTVIKSMSGLSPRAQWAYDYNVLQPFAKLDMWPTVFGKVLPVSFFAQYIQNLSVSDWNKGYMYGLSVGKAKNPGTFEFGASWASIKSDATLGMWTDSDRWGGGTDGEGAKLYAKYQVLKNLQTSLTYFMDQKPLSNTPQKDYDRWQIDLIASF
jgi:hypothetical protein